MSDQDLEKRLDKLLINRIDENKNSAKLAKSFAVLNTSLMQREEKRLAKKLGKKHPRVSELKQKGQDIVNNIKTTTKTAVKKESIDTAVNADEVLIEGRILDENGVGVENVNVCLVDESGKKISAANGFTTNSNGRYGFKLPQSAVSGGNGNGKQAFRVVVESPKAKVIHKEAQSLELVVGAKHKRDVVINRAKLIRKR